MKLTFKQFLMESRNYKKVSGPEESHDDYVYHATNENNAEQIAHEGIKVHRPHEFTDQDTWPDGNTSKRNYFGSTAHNSWKFAPEYGTPVLLRIPKNKHPFKKESWTGDIFSNTTVPPNIIEFLNENNQWEPIIDLQ